MAAGRMVKCSRKGCERSARLLHGIDDWTCVPCTEGQPPFQTRMTRQVGQPKQKAAGKGGKKK